MNNSDLLVVIGVLLLSAGMTVWPAGSAQAANGSEWEMTTNMEIPGMPFAMPPTIRRQCLQDQAVPFRDNEDQNCQVITKKKSGDTMNWKLVCDGPDGKSEMTGVTKYTGDTMDTNIQVKGDQGEMSIHTTGKKLGPCK